MPTVSKNVTALLSLIFGFLSVILHPINSGGFVFAALAIASGAAVISDKSTVKLYRSLGIGGAVLGAIGLLWAATFLFVDFGSSRIPVEQAPESAGVPPASGQNGRTPELLHKIP